MPNYGDNTANTTLSEIAHQGQMQGLTGGRNVFKATSHLGLKIKRSAKGIVGFFDFAVSTVNIDGSIWSFEMLPTLTNFSIAYCEGRYQGLWVSPAYKKKDLVGDITESKSEWNASGPRIFDSLSMPRNYVERRVFLVANKEFTGDLVRD